MKSYYFLLLWGPLALGAASHGQVEPALAGVLSGSAVIDKAPVREAAGAQPADLLVRADGFTIRITTRTKIEWNPPLQSVADLKAGNWINFKGKLDSAGVLVAASVRIGPNLIDSREEKLRVDKEYDPSAIPADAKQNYLKEEFVGGCRDLYVEGCDPQTFPPYRNAEMQARIEKIGNRLVPTYQRALPDSDPAKIDFRFQLIDTKLFREALGLPGGTVLVPHQVVERLQNDSQIATVLADGIARGLERQQYRTERKVMTASALALGAAFVPYAGLFMGSSAEVGANVRTIAMEQRDRVSLVLMHDAGYEVDEAPTAWWLLASGKPKPLSKIIEPERAIYLQSILDAIWHNPGAARSPQQH